MYINALYGTAGKKHILYWIVHNLKASSLSSVIMQNLSTVLFKIFINDLDDGVKCITVTGNKLEDMADSPGGCIAIQRILEGLEMWTDKNLINFYKKCKVLYFGRNNSRHQYMLEAT